MRKVLNLLLAQPETMQRNNGTGCDPQRPLEECLYTENCSDMNTSGPVIRPDVQTTDAPTPSFFGGGSASGPTALMNDNSAQLRDAHVAVSSSHGRRDSRVYQYKGTRKYPHVPLLVPQRTEPEASERESTKSACRGGLALWLLAPDWLEQLGCIPVSVQSLSSLSRRRTAT